MKNPLKNPVFCAVMLASVLQAQEPTATPNLTSAKILDQRSTEASQNTIKQAAQQGDVDTLFVAMQKNVEPEYCLKQVRYLPKVKQAQLFARILSDENILMAAPFKGTYPPGSSTFDTMRPFLVERLSYQILGEPQPAYHGMMTREEMKALAVKLRALQ